jgi:putative ABC transport system ATP-binding protein
MTSVLSTAASGGAKDLVISIKDLKFGWNADQQPVINIGALRIDKGQNVFLHGPSGCGKTTLLSLLAGVLPVQQGELTVLDRNLGQMTDAARDRFRADHIGIIFQMFNLIPYLSVIENVILPCRFSKKRQQRALSESSSVEKQAISLLKDLEMSAPDLLLSKVSNLSVGQQQRVAAARALMGAPELVIADEPTSALDSELRHGFIRLLFEECAREGAT